MADLATALRDFNKERKFSRKGPLCVALVITQHARKMGLPLDPDKLLTDAALTLPTVTQMRLGGRFNSTTSQLYGHLRRVSFWRRRLTNAQVQGITA